MNHCSLDGEFCTNYVKQSTGYFKTKIWCYIEIREVQIMIKGLEFYTIGGNQIYKEIYFIMIMMIL